MSAPSKAQRLTQIHTLLKRRYKLEPRDTRLNVLEAVIYAICREGVTREQANQAMARFKDEFFDWNEVRVSSLEEIESILAGLPDPEERAQRLRRFLRQLFEKTYGFALDALTKKPLKEAIKSLHEYEAFQSDYVVATVVQMALGGHAVPIDGPIRRGLDRLGIGDAKSDDHALRNMLERSVPKNRGIEFVDLMEELTHDTCVSGEPDCPRCELKKVCPTGQVRMTAPKTAPKAAVTSAKSKVAKSKPAADGKPGRAAAKSAPAKVKAAAAKTKPRRAK
jgi:endonuclease-3